ncbi:MAG TPA: damage-inducible protein DinB [Janthinobacterium sp.]|nr:damage-inducible protein DinB [Janthinobacterium sp.]
MLRTLFAYQAWANGELLQKMAGFDTERHQEEYQTALRLINHSHVVSQIFAAHLVGKKHEFTADNTPQTPSLADLRAAVAESDRWYLQYLESVTSESLSESLPFVFTDGDRGTMSREEMLAHVVTHAVYHRGEVGQIMKQLSLALPWDTFAVYLHRNEPSRRSGSL